MKKDAILHLGCDATGLVSIIRHFHSIISLDIYLINDDTTFDKDEKVLFWSNLKRQRYFDLAPELGFNYQIFDRIDFRNIYDIFDLENLKNVCNSHNVIHFVISNTCTDILTNVDSIIQILKAKSIRTTSSYFVIYLVNNFTSIEFKEVITKLFPEIDFDKIVLIECLTDVLNSMPYENYKKCIVAAEDTGILIYLNKSDVKEIWEYEHKQSIKFLFSRKSSTILDFSILKEKNKIYTCLKFLLAIYTADAEQIFIFGYFKFISSGRLVAEKIIDEIDNIMLADSKYQGIHRIDLVNYMRRLENFGGNVFNILQISKKGLEEAKKFLHQNLDQGMKKFQMDKQRNKYTISKFDYIPYAFEILDSQINLCD